MNRLRSGILALMIATLMPFNGTFASDDAGPTSVMLSSIIIYSPNIKELSAFYEKALGFPARDTELDDHIGYWLGGNYVGFEPTTASLQTTGRVSAWFSVNDIEQAYRRVLDHGARPVMGPTPQPWGDVHATAIDPEGNLFGLIQMVEQR